MFFASKLDYLFSYTSKSLSPLGKMKKSLKSPEKRQFPSHLPSLPPAATRSLVTALRPALPSDVGGAGGCALRRRPRGRWIDPYLTMIGYPRVSEPFRVCKTNALCLSQYFLFQNIKFSCFSLFFHHQTQFPLCFVVIKGIDRV